MTEPAATPTSRPTRRPLRLSLGVLALLVVGPLVGLYARGAWRLDAALDRWAATGDPTTLAEVEWGDGRPGAIERAAWHAELVDALADGIGAWEVARRAPEVALPDPDGASVEAWFAPGSRPGVIPLVELAQALPEAADDLERAARDLEALADSADVIAAGPTLVECLARIAALRSILDRAEPVLALAAERGDDAALLRVRRVLERFDPLARLRAVARVERAFGRDVFVALRDGGDPADVLGEEAPDLGPLDGLWRALRAPIEAPLRVADQADFHEQWEERLARLDRDWHEPGSFAGAPDPADGGEGGVATRLLAADWAPPYERATFEEARRRLALCAAAFALDGELGLDRALRDHSDPFTGEPFERADAGPELRSPGAPPAIDPLAWPLPKRAPSKR